jgi:hypothetical protein
MVSWNISTFVLLDGSHGFDVLWISCGMKRELATAHWGSCGLHDFRFQWDLHGGLADRREELGVDGLQVTLIDVISAHRVWDREHGFTIAL